MKLKLLSAILAGAIASSCQQQPQKIPIAIATVTTFPKGADSCNPPDPALRIGEFVLLLKGDDVIADTTINKVEARVDPEYLISEEFKELRDASTFDIGDCISRAVFELPEGMEIPQGTELTLLFSSVISVDLKLKEDGGLSYRVK